MRCIHLGRRGRPVAASASHQGKGGKPRIVRIGYEAARALDRYIRARARHAQAWQPQLWLGTRNRGPLTANGIYQMIARRGRQCGVDVFPHRFRHHFSHTWLDRGGAEGDLMELNGWTSPQMLRRYGPAPAEPGPAAPTTASWTTAHDETPMVPGNHQNLAGVAAVRHRSNRV